MTNSAALYTTAIDPKTFGNTPRRRASNVYTKWRYVTEQLLELAPGVYQLDPYKLRDMGITVGFMYPTEPVTCAKGLRAYIVRNNIPSLKPFVSGGYLYVHRFNDADNCHLKDNRDKRIRRKKEAD